MIKLRALNEESSEESEGEDETPAVTKEALEQTSFAEYNQALELLRAKKLEEARDILKELLTSEYLIDVQKLTVPEGLVQPGLALKYSCLKNMGHIQELLDDKTGALEFYLKAVELDDGDVTLWFKIGCVATKVLEYELASEAFQEGLRCSSHHWPCLENLIIMLYVLNDYITCLFCIARAFESDPDFLAGLAIRDKIISEQASIIGDFELYCKGYNIGSMNEVYDNSIAETIVKKALDMREARRHIVHAALTPKPVKSATVKFESNTWIAMGEAILKYHKEAERFSASVSLILASEIDKAETEKMTDVIPNENGAATNLIEENGDNMDVEEEVPVDPSTEQKQIGEGEDSKSRKRRRSQIAFMEQWMWGGKRRSARVRSTVKREAEREESNLEEALRRLVPSALLPSNMKENSTKIGDNIPLNEDSMDTMDLYKLFERRESVEGAGDDKNSSQSKTATSSKVKEAVLKAVEDEGYFGLLGEQDDVEKFTNMSQKGDIIELLSNYVTALSHKWQLTWPPDLLQIYMDTYVCLREHVPHPSIFESHGDEVFKTDAMITMLYLELFIDKLLAEKTELMLDHLGPAEDLGQLLFLSSKKYLFGADYLPLVMRIFWLKAHLFLHQGNVKVAIQSLDNLMCHFEDSEEEDQKTKVTIPNCQHHNNVSREGVLKLLTTLIRNQSLNEVQRLYDEKQYEKLSEILQETFRYQQSTSSGTNKVSENCPDRASQLGMLMDALWQTKKYQECFYWGEACCNEAFQKYLGSEDKEQQKWATTIEKILAGLESCVTKSGLSVVDSPRLPRLVQNLMHMICHQLDAPETAVEMPIESVTPWILLQQIMQWEESKGKGQGIDVVYEDLVPNSILLLFTAHEHLAKRSWCCANEGALLLHIMDVVVPLVQRPELVSFKEQVFQPMEQVFFCLYAHPNKKTKSRFLQDHGVPQITLIWERAIQLFQFYKPIQLPEFDSYRVASITPDVEILLKRIIQLIPQQSDPVLLVDRMGQFVEGQLTELPIPPNTYQRLPTKVNCIYYLLGDFYFKNSEWPKAIRHYLLDVCVNPIRLDSWAGMALARGSQLETRLNSCEHLKSESEFLRRAEAAYRCFTRSLEIDNIHSLLWIEKGNFVYTVHSFCSRLLKQETDSLSLEKFTLLEEQKERMLNVADTCFNSALTVWYNYGQEGNLQDERWLLHYMLGKVAEKRDLSPKIILDHYAKSSKFLDVLGASYTRKITYSNPQNLSVEALEVFYRIHASILKHLEQCEGKILDQTVQQLFQQTLNDAANGPFMARQSESKPETEDDRKKRPAVSPPDQYDYRSKRRCVDETLELSVMEDVINLMEDMISKVADNTVYIPEEAPEKEQLLGTKTIIKSKVTNDSAEVVVISDDSSDSVIDTLNNKKVLDSPKELSEAAKNESQKKSLQVKQASDERSSNTFSKDKPVQNKAKDSFPDGSNPDSGRASPFHDIPLDMEIVCEDDSQPLPNVTFRQASPKAKNNDHENTILGLESPLILSKLNIESKEVARIAVTSDAAVLRRSSQESTTTGTTRTESTTSTGNTSNSSSDSSSSDQDEDSSDSSSSNDSSDSSGSDSEDPNQSTGTVVAADIGEKCEKIKDNPVIVQKKASGPRQMKTNNGINDHNELVRKCLIALEECVLRFPHHYKSLYRLSHYYFHSKYHRDVRKCRELLLGIYKCHLVPGRNSGSTVQGLFADRKNTNFFNGVWRIPIPEIDRPGCFASHMSRCILLLMDVLRELRDHSLLLELCVALRRTPEPDKKYLREPEREQLSRQALSLTLQTLRARLRDEPTSALVLEMFRTYQTVQKLLPQKEKTFASLLIEAYKKHKKCETGSVEEAISFCQREILNQQCAPLPPVQPTIVPTPPPLPAPPHVQIPSVPVKSSVTPTPTSSKKPATVTTTTPTTGTAAAVTSTTTVNKNLATTPRPRGRPPGSSRAGPPIPSQPILPPSSAPPFTQLHPLFNDPTALLNMLDPLNMMMQAQMSNFQAELLRQIAASSMGSMLNAIPSMTSNVPNTSSSFMRERPNVSILPVSSASSTHTKQSASLLKMSNTPSTPKTTSVIPHTKPTMPLTKVSSPSQLIKHGTSPLLPKSSIRTSVVKAPTVLAHPKLSASKSIQPVVQSKLPATDNFMKSAPRPVHNISPSNTSPFQKPSPTKTSPLYLGMRDAKYANQSSLGPSAAYSPTGRKGPENLLPSNFPLNQISPPSRKRLVKPNANMVTYKQELDLLGRSGSHPVDLASLAMYKTNKPNSSIVPPRSSYKPSDSKDTSAQLTRGQSNEPPDFLLKTQNRSPKQPQRTHLNPNSIPNMGREITVSSSSSASAQSSGLSMLSRLQQQSGQLEIIAKPKTSMPSPIDLHVNIPSSITITPKKSQQSLTPESKILKKVKDMVSIVEIGKIAQRNINPPPASIPKPWPPPAPPKKDKETELGSGVEVITLE